MNNTFVPQAVLNRNSLSVRRTLIMTRIWLMLGCLVWTSPAGISAGEVVSGAPQVLETVLRNESLVSATTSDRREVLRVLRESAADHPELWWQSGYVRQGQHWQPVELAVEKPPSLEEYRNRRESAKWTAVEQLHLADWCQAQGLADQERTHRIRALLTGEVEEPAKVMARLGYRRVGPWWFTPEELQSYVADTQATAREARRLQPRLEHLMTRLEESPKQRERAIADLRSLTTNTSLPVLEAVVAPRSEATATALVEVLDGIDTYRASHILARMAIASPWPGVRESAITSLKQRPLEDYVPMVLSYLYKPIDLKQSVEWTPTSFPSFTKLYSPEWRFLFVRECRNSIEVSILKVFDQRFLQSARFIPPSRYIDNRLRSEASFRQSQDVFLQYIQNMDQINDSVSEINELAGTMLATLTGEPFSNDPTVWWQWWDSAIADVERTAPKQTLIVNEQRQAIEGALIWISCLAAGTPIWTDQGLVAIEKIQPGDRVLAKNIETGELAYKPVLQTTHRQNAKLTSISAGRDTFEASPGHHFWISGRGWTRTNQLTSGMPAHTVTGRSTLTVEETGRTADVFNLIVADFHTYFIGQTMILSHDVQPPSPTDIRVPGLAPEVP